MAPNATIHHLEISLSDVDRNVYESLDLRVARHPSETMRWLLLRTLAYCLSYEDGIAFSKGGLSASDDPPIAIHDPTGILVAWIDVGSPSAERLHRASKAARRVAVFTSDLAAVRREASARAIHKAEDVEVWCVSPKLLDELEKVIGKSAKLELLRTDGALYVTVGGATIEGSIERAPLLVSAH
jgi:uncharacterized protein YaeQ